MTASEFVAKLAAANPTVEDFTKLGLSPKEAKSMLRGYICKERDEPLGIEEANEVLTLLNRWETRNVEVGLIRFAKAPARHPQGTKIGVVEVDPIVIRPDHQLVAYEEGTRDNALWAVAESPGKFLDALAVAAKF